MSTPAAQLARAFVALSDCNPATANAARLYIESIYADRPSYRILLLNMVGDSSIDPEPRMFAISQLVSVLRDDPRRLDAESTRSLLSHVATIISAETCEKVVILWSRVILELLDSLLLSYLDTLSTTFSETLQVFLTSATTSNDTLASARAEFALKIVEHCSFSDATLREFFFNVSLSLLTSASASVAAYAAGAVCKMYRTSGSVDTPLFVRVTDAVLGAAVRVAGYSDSVEPLLEHFLSLIRARAVPKGVERSLMTSLCSLLSQTSAQGAPYSLRGQLARLIGALDDLIPPSPTLGGDDPTVVGAMQAVAGTLNGLLIGPEDEWEANNVDDGWTTPAGRCVYACEDLLDHLARNHTIIGGVFAQWVIESINMNNNQSFYGLFISLAMVMEGAGSNFAGKARLQPDQLQALVAGALTGVLSLQVDRRVHWAAVNVVGRITQDIPEYISALQDCLVQFYRTAIANVSCRVVANATGGLAALVARAPPTAAGVLGAAVMEIAATVLGRQSFAADAAIVGHTLECVRDVFTSVPATQAGAAYSQLMPIIVSTLQNATPDTCDATLTPALISAAVTMVCTVGDVAGGVLPLTMLLTTLHTRLNTVDFQLVRSDVYYTLQAILDAYPALAAALVPAPAPHDLVTSGALELIQTQCLATADYEYPSIVSARGLPLAFVPPAQARALAAERRARLTTEPADNQQCPEGCSAVELLDAGSEHAFASYSSYALVLLELYRARPAPVATLAPLLEKLTAVAGAIDYHGRYNLVSYAGCLHMVALGLVRGSSDVLGEWAATDFGRAVVEAITSAGTNGDDDESMYPDDDNYGSIEFMELAGAWRVLVECALQSSATHDAPMIRYIGARVDFILRDITRMIGYVNDEYTSIIGGADCADTDSLRANYAATIALTEPLVNLILGANAISAGRHGVADLVSSMASSDNPALCACALVSIAQVATTSVALSAAYGCMPAPAHAISQVLLDCLANTLYNDMVPECLSQMQAACALVAGHIALSVASTDGPVHPPAGLDELLRRSSEFLTVPGCESYRIRDRTAAAVYATFAQVVLLLRLGTQPEDLPALFSGAISVVVTTIVADDYVQTNFPQVLTALEWIARLGGFTQKTADSLQSAMEGVHVPARWARRVQTLLAGLHEPSLLM